MNLNKLIKWLLKWSIKHKETMNQDHKDQQDHSKLRKCRIKYKRTIWKELTKLNESWGDKNKGRCVPMAIKWIDATTCKFLAL